jgi:hypothetical protein
MLLSFTGLTKVLVTNGHDKGSKKMDIIDLSDPTNVCQPSFLVADYPNFVGAGAGLLSNNNALLICGGSNPRKLDDCFAINNNGIIQQSAIRLTKPRSGAASVVLNGNTLWMTGGMIQSGFQKTKSTEFVQLTGTTPGPDLPLVVAEHCLVSLNDTTALLIGGELQDRTYSKATIFYNKDDKTWTNGPSIITGRAGHSCALFKSPQHGHTDTVIVTGGYNRANELASTEFLNLESNSWESGKGQLNSS